MGGFGTYTLFDCCLDNFPPIIADILVKINFLYS
jgi:hypothetical protein